MTIPGEAATAAVVTLESPGNTSTWLLTRVSGVEGWTDEDGTLWVRARDDEEPQIIVKFTRIAGMMPIRLVRASESGTVKRVERKARREQRALRVRGLA